MRRKSFGILFFINRTKLLKNGEAPIVLRISVEGIRAESQIKRSVLPHFWDQATETCKGRDRNSIETNEYIRSLKLKALTIHKELEMRGAHFNARLIMNQLYCVEEKKTLLSIFRKHNENLHKLIGIDYEKITVCRYDNCCRYLEDMIKQQYHKDDVTLVEIDSEFIRNYEMHLKTVRGCAQNTVIRYMKCFKKIINQALADGLLVKDPFLGIRFTAKEVIKDVLTKDELETLIKRKFRILRLEHVRDVFIFCCYTGIAYIDAYTLRAEHIVRDNNKDWWIKKTREKTNIEFHVPLLKIPLQILKKYSKDPSCQKTGLLFPITSNQKMNGYLKEIAELCRIKKNLTTHTARRTYATTICHESGVAIENIAKMLGHTDVRMTLHYTKISDSTVKRDMAKARKIFG